MQAKVIWKQTNTTSGITTSFENVSTFVKAPSALKTAPFSQSLLTPPTNLLRPPPSVKARL